MNKPFNDFPFEEFFTLSDLDSKRNTWLLPFPDSQIKYPEIITDIKEQINIYTINKGGHFWYDLIYCGWPSLFVVSHTLHNLLAEASGIRFYPVSILDKNLEILEKDYYGFHITGSCGAFIKSLSREELARRIPNGPQFVKKTGLYFNPATWDKSDFFIPEGTASILITKSVRDIIVKNKLTNIKMEQIIEVETF